MRFDRLVHRAEGAGPALHDQLDDGHLHGGGYVGLERRAHLQQRRRATALLIALMDMQGAC